MASSLSQKTMISQAILVTTMMLFDSGRCWEPKPMPTCPTTCGNLTSPSPLSTSLYSNMDYSSLITPNYNYSLPKPFLDLPTVLDGLTYRGLSSLSLASNFSVYKIINCSGTAYYNTSWSFSEGDQKKHGSDRYPQRQRGHFMLLCLFLVFVVPASGIYWIMRWSKQKKVVKLRRGLFIRNGGDILEATQSSLLVFTAEDLKKATNNYDESNVLCQEPHLGVTYKGILPRVNCGVSIQFCRLFDGCKTEILISNLVALSRISHRNVVKLLGCCLETQIPLVVYEFISCNTLSYCIKEDSVSWDVRLKIAADTAGALAYLHSAGIIHGCLNSSTILLDHAHSAKVNGFALACSECSCVEFYGNTTSSYLHPDVSSGRMTEKTDVYSFGIILAELLTGKGVMNPEWLEGDENLAKYSLGSSRGDDILPILDDRLVTDDDDVAKLTEVARIAKRCLSSSSQERPTMKEVAISLECLIIS